MAGPGSTSGYRQRLEDVMRGTGEAGPPLGTQGNPFTVGGQGQAGQWFRGSRPGQFGYPTQQQLPENIGAIRDLLRSYQQRPAGYPFTEEQQQFRSTWEGVYNVPGRGEDPNAPFNMGPLIAASAFNPEPVNPWTPWKPAQAEAVPEWMQGAMV